MHQLAKVTDPIAFHNRRQLSSFPYFFKFFIKEDLLNTSKSQLLQLSALAVGQTFGKPYIVTTKKHEIAWMAGKARLLKCKNNFT